MNGLALARLLVLAMPAVCGLAETASAAVDYSFLTAIPVPATSANLQPGGVLSSFDISYADMNGYYYLADRSNGAVDIVNGAINSVVAQAGVGMFTGQQPTTSKSGPDGVVVAHTPAGATLFAGNGDSTLLSFNVNNPANPTPQFPPLNTGGNFRVDEMAYSPSANLVLAANNADTPAFGTLVNASTGTAVAGPITVSSSPPSGGLEQPAWDSKTGTFFISVPALNGTNSPGGVAEITTTGAVVNTYDFATLGLTSCSPTGLAVGGSGHLLVGCGNAKTQTVLLDPSANGGKGAILKTFTDVSGSDELWYDPASGDFYVTGVDSNGNRIFAVISDATATVLQLVSVPNVNAHSIAVDPLNEEVFLPLEPNSLCPGGCIAVYAQSVGVPEPSSLPLLAFAGLGLIGLAMLQRRSHQMA